MITIMNTKNSKIKSMIIANQIMTTMNTAYIIHPIQSPYQFIRARVVQLLKFPRDQTLLIHGDDSELFYTIREICTLQGEYYLCMFYPGITNPP